MIHLYIVSGDHTIESHTAKSPDSNTGTSQPPPATQTVLPPSPVDETEEIQLTEQSQTLKISEESKEFFKQLDAALTEQETNQSEGSRDNIDQSERNKASADQSVKAEVLVDISHKSKGKIDESESSSIIVQSQGSRDNIDQSVRSKGVIDQSESRMTATALEGGKAEGRKADSNSMMVMIALEDELGETRPVDIDIADEESKENETENTGEYD